MKQILLGLALLTGIAGTAQTNVFLDQGFWKASPDVAAVKAAIEKGNDPAASNNMGFDGVVNAINAKAPTETIKFMLAQKGNDINKITHDSRTYIFWAASKGDLNLIEHIIKSGADLKLKDSHGMSPMGFAAGTGQSDTAVYAALLRGGADLKAVNDNGANILLVGIPGDKDLMLTNYLLSKGLSLKSVDSDGNNAFDYAARSGNQALLEQLLKKGLKPTKNAMLLASQGTRNSNNTLAFFQYLEGLGLPVNATNANGENALHAIVRKPNQAEVIKYFLSKGVNPAQADKNGTTAIHNAAASNKDTAVLALLGATPQQLNTPNKKGLTPLTLAVRSNAPEVVQYLLTKGAVVTANDEEGNNIGFYLVQSFDGRRAGEFEAKLKALQAAGFDPATPQKNGNTLLHLAVMKNDLALLEYVAGLSLDVNTRNKEGLTALHKAAMISKDDSLLKYLLSIGARKDLTTEFKETAFDLAKENEFFSTNKVATDFLK